MSTEIRSRSRLQLLVAEDYCPVQATDQDGIHSDS
eukprot:XP_001709760.1 Hypothetical protein GL50803_9488 [Giardia lamblia ATCC 50803]